jgi:hypothetical protein
LFFLDDGRNFTAPRRYTIQYLDHGQWRDVGPPATGPIANGVNADHWIPVTARHFRVRVAAPGSDRAVRLLEWKLYAAQPQHRFIGR